jgi:capsular polysaccharide biosynthesis protein
MNKENRSDEVSLFELFNVLRRYKWLLLGLPFIAAVLTTFLVFFVLRPSWEASAVLEIGRVGQAGQAGQAEQRFVEPVSNVVKRLTLPSFAKGAINFAGVKADELKAMQGFYSTLKATQVAGTDLVEIKLRGPSPDAARNLILGCIGSLQKTHSEMMLGSIERNNKEVQILTEGIKKVGAETELLRKKLLAEHNWNAFDATLSATILKDKASELRDMIQRKLMLEEQLSPLHTYTTKVVEEIFISDGPVSPKKPLLIGLAVLLGLLGAVFIAFVHNSVVAAEN